MYWGGTVKGKQILTTEHLGNTSTSGSGNLFEVNLSVKLENGKDGIIKVGITNQDAATRSFRTAFPNACLITIAIPNINNDNETPLNWNRSFVTGWTTTGFTCVSGLGGSGNSRRLSYVAIGY